MVKPRSSFNMPTYRPRRIWLNSVGAQNGSVDENTLKKSLPYCDIETGTKNRVVNRDPISGLGLLGKEYDPLQENRIRAKTPRESVNRDPINGKGELGEELNVFSIPKRIVCKQRTYRNPLDTASCNATGEDNDTLRPKGKPTKGSVRQAQRDPISGRGDFGKEWDPIHGYSGRPRPWHQQPRDEPLYYYRFSNRPMLNKYDLLLLKEYYAARGGKSNPVTGEDVNSFDINKELKRTPRNSAKKTSNPVTGDNCETFTVSETLNEKRLKSGSKINQKVNPVTGENCKSFEINIESRPKTPRTAAKSGNPLTGDNCPNFSYSKEFKPKTPRPSTAGDAKNPLTGSNCTSYTYSTEDRPKTASAATPRSNPVTGENCNHFVVNTQERKSNSTKVYVESNPLTGNNIKSFDIDQQMRVNRRPSNGSVASTKSAESNGSCISMKSPVSSNGGSPARNTSSYNPITGQAN